MSIIDSIQLSGSSYDVRDKSATTVVSLTQQEYDALPSSAKTANILYNITDATAGDLTQYWTSAQTQSAITEAVSGKQDTLVSGTNIKTINNESILGSGNITIQGGGTDTGTVQTMIDQSISGKADSSTVTALTNTVTGHTADTSIHVTTAQTAAWDAKSDFSGSYNDLTDKPTIPTVPTSNTAFTNDAGYITSSALNGYATTGDVQTATSGKVDTSTYTAYTASTDAALATKQTTLTAGTNITIVDNVISAEGGGKAIKGGRGISVTTGETADTVSFNLPISAGTGVNSLIIAGARTATGQKSIAIGTNSAAYGTQSIAINQSTANGQDSFSQGTSYAQKTRSSAFGQQNYSNNDAELSCGRYNNSVTASTTFGDSGNTLFSVGNGTSNSARHNAFEIRQNGDIYLSSGGTDIKLQDHLGGGGITSGEVQTMIDSSISGKVNSSDVYLKSETSGATEIATALSTKQDTLVSGTSIKTINNESILGSGNITIQGGGGEVSSAITSGDTNAVAGGAVFDAVVYSGNTYTTELTFDANGYAENWVVGTSAITIDVSGYTSSTNANYQFENSNGEILGDAGIYKYISTWGSSWTNNADNCTITTDGDTATTATITDIPSGTVKVRRRGENNPPKAIISGVTPETWIKDALDDHRDNTTVHITAAERSTWNNKSNFSGSYNDLTDKPIPDSALNVASTNPVQNQALYNELRLSDGGEAETTIEWSGSESTNYPNGCTKIKVEVVGSSNWLTIDFYNDGQPLGNITINNWGSITVDVGNFQGSTYEISGTTVIISYPTVTNVTKIRVTGSGNYVYKAITSSTTPLKDQVVTNTTALGGLSLVKLTQAQYDALVTKDSNTLYVIVN